MAKINPNFPYDLFRFIHKPLRIEDVSNDNFLERYLTGEQAHFEDTQDKILGILELNNPEKIREDLLVYLKDIVGLTKDLRNITDGLSTDDLRKIILLAIPLWKTKGLDVGFKNIIKLFTGFNARVYNWFDYRMIIGEKAIGEEQLGEDSWLISKVGVEGQTPIGSCVLLLQFENQNINDGSIYQSPIIAYGDGNFASGGPYSSSDYYLKGTEHFLRIPNRVVFDLVNSFSFECQFTSVVTGQIIPLFHKYDNDLSKGISISIDTSTNEINVLIDDPITPFHVAQATGVTLANGNWHHIAVVMDSDQNELSIWVDGTRIYNSTIAGGLIINDINNEKDIFIGATQSTDVGNAFGIDGIRFTLDARYDTSLATITPPGTNFIEYQAEQLDEYQIDIRVVDNGTLDRTLLKRILNLMRPVSERINIAYIDFFDDFENGKGQYTTISGSSYVELVNGNYILKLPELSLDHVNVLGSTAWKNYLAQHRCSIYSGNQFEIRFLIQDDANFYAFRINTVDKLAYCEKVVGGIRTSLSSPVAIDVETASPPVYIPYYIFTISTFKNENTGITTLRCYIDSNQIFKVDDSEYSVGTFGLYTYTGTTLWCSESEMFQLPLETEKIVPNSEY